MERLSRRDFLKLSAAVIASWTLLGDSKSYLNSPGLIIENKSTPRTASVNNPYIDKNKDLTPYQSEQIPQPDYYSSLKSDRALIKELELEKKLTKPATTETKDKLAEVIYHGNITKPEIYLTIDDCFIVKSVEAALDVAEKYGIKLTFFPVGTKVNETPSLYKEIVQKGHSVENHTWSHEWLAGKTSSEIEYQIRKQQETVQKAVGYDYQQYFFRPPGGSGIFEGNYRPLLEVCGKLGLQIAMWGPDSNGWKVYPKTDDQAEKFILKNVFSEFYEGAIVLQHALPNDMIALPKIIEKAKENGWQMNTLKNGLIQDKK